MNFPKALWLIKRKTIGSYFIHSDFRNKMSGTHFNSSKYIPLTSAAWKKLEKNDLK